MFWFARLTRDPIPGDTVGFHPVAEWAQAIRTADPTATALIDTLLEATDTVHVSNTRSLSLNNIRPPMGRIILCGDADHAITPATAREAIEDALALFNALTTGASPAEAMAARRIAVAVAVAVERECQARIYSRVMPGTPTTTSSESDSATKDPDDDTDFRDGMDWATRMWFT